GMVDLTENTEPRANELQRRILLCQYFTHIQCETAVPPQETRLTYNSWYGRPHLEMVRWHWVNHALWGNGKLVREQLNWYAPTIAQAQKLAQRQGYAGARWLKMTDPQANQGPSSVGAFLLWQQPHPIFLAE